MHRVNRILCHLQPEMSLPEPEPVASSSSSVQTTFADDDVVIVSTARTAQGSFGGSLAGFTAVQLGSVAIKAAVERAGIPAARVDEVIFGNVLSAGIGQAPARQAALGAGLNASVPCTTVNKVCASGMKAVALAAQSIRCGSSDVVVVGGMESMSNAPYYLPKARFGSKFGHVESEDAIVKDGLFDPYNKQLMGDCAELCAKTFDVSREQQDDFAEMSYARAKAAHEAGKFAQEIVPITIKGRRGKPDTVVDKDEEYTRFNPQKARAMRPVFQKDGTVTVANASPLSDGAAAMVVMSGRAARAFGVKPRAIVVSWADAAREPEYFTVAPALALPKALRQAGVRKEEVDLYELNEAFAVVGVANAKLLGLSTDKINIYGGGVSLGHPLGCSGARIVVTLLTALENEGKNLGAAAVCNGGGGASAMVIRRLG